MSIKALLYLVGAALMLIVILGGLFGLSIV